MRSLCLALAVTGTTAFAEPPLTAEAFDTLTLGRTMTWSEFGQVYGIEEYLPGRRLRWTALGNDCTTGHWYPDGSLICFLYEDRGLYEDWGDPVCWEITESATGLHARHSSRPAPADPVVIEETSNPMACFGPKVGA